MNIFGINKNLYNKEIKVNFIRFIRLKKFKGLEQLKKQIKIDITQAKKMSKDNLHFQKPLFL